MVLLDEIDRMQKEELMTLLKFLRGCPSLPNISFVCAFQQDQVERMACDKSDADSTEYMEKFFPVNIDLPEISSDSLAPVLLAELSTGFRDANWVFDESRQQDFKKRFDQLWNGGLNRLCTNLRKCRLFSSDVGSVAHMIGDEVDSSDLCAIQALQKFHPKAHRVVWTNASYCSHSFDWWKSYQPQTDRALENIRKRIRDSIDSSVLPGDRPVVDAILTFMFPERMRDLSEGRPQREKDDLSASEARRGISHPDYFPIYFVRSVPEAVFSNEQLGEFLVRLGNSRDEAQRDKDFDSVFETFERNSLRVRFPR